MYILYTILYIIMYTNAYLVICYCLYMRLALWQANMDWHRTRCTQLPACACMHASHGSGGMLAQVSGDCVPPETGVCEFVGRARHCAHPQVGSHPSNTLTDTLCFHISTGAPIVDAVEMHAQCLDEMIACGIVPLGPSTSRLHHAREHS